MSLQAPDTFGFPFPPYPIQHDFMTRLYEALETKKMGIFESPTGTGKSLSIICGALQWLQDHNRKERSVLDAEIKRLEKEKEVLAADSTDWLSSQAEEIQLAQQLGQVKLEYNKIQKYDKKIEKLVSKKKKRDIPEKKLYEFGVSKLSDRQAVVEKAVEEEEEDDEEHMMLDEANPPAEEESSDEEDAAKYEPVKIFICSRTHSQLSQLVGEIVKSPFGRETRVASLASRQTYCINPAVLKLKHISLINERCLDMQKKESKATKSDADGKTVKRQKGSCQCPYNKQQNIEELRDECLLEVQDVEDLVSQAKELKACPYYASRKAVEDAQVVLVPYNTLLHKSTREASGIKLKNNVVIVDEAHNLLDALAQMYSADITLAQLEEANQRLRAYKQKYSTRFSSYNLLCINQMIFIISKLINVLRKSKDALANESSHKVFTVQEFVLAAEVDNYNMFKYVKFCRDSKIAQKIHSFASKFSLDLVEDTKPKKSGLKEFLSSIQNKKNGTETVAPPPEAPEKAKVLGNPFLAFVSFLEALTCSYDDGRVIAYKSEDRMQSKLSFLLLNSAARFKEIVEQARSVIVAGGTMKPMSEFRDRLFISAGASAHRIMEFTCGHIIPPENILPVIIPTGLKNEKLLFNFENRFTMGSSLKEILLGVCKTVRGGVVVFFPSYKYEAWVYQQLQGVSLRLPLFREQSGCSVDSVLNSYAAEIRKPQSRGAVLFSVVGGKLSEGLNFSDDLGRCVIVVGLPYANINSAELKEKMAYLDKAEGTGAGQKFYEAMCMKAVNQCIGRAVRHKNDYACVLLLDVRYDRPATKNSLPDWIRRSLVTNGMNEAITLMDKFFADRS